MDVIRFKDKYGRKAKPYEGKNFLKKINKNQLIFKKPKKNSKNTYNFQNIKITLKYINNSKQIKNYKKKVKIYNLGIEAVKRYVKEYQVDCDWNDSGKYFASSKLEDEEKAKSFSNLLTNLNHLL